MYNILNIQYQTHPEEKSSPVKPAWLHDSAALLTDPLTCYNNTLTQAYLMAVIMHSYCVNLY